MANLEKLLCYDHSMHFLKNGIIIEQIGNLEKASYVLA